MKFNWGQGLVIANAVFTAGVFIMVSISISKDVDLVTPNYYDKEYLLVEKVTPKLKKYHRGDVVIFKYPQNQQLDFIKRIIGMPGETLQIENGKITIVNNEHPQGIILGETYLPSDIYSASTSTNFKVTLGQNQVFVMGDNRANSLDSRSFGALDEKLIIGKPMISFRNFHRILRPKYNVLLPKMKFLASK